MGDHPINSGSSPFKIGGVFIVEGNIGAGKTSLCLELGQQIKDAKVFLEPTVTNPYLEDFYRDPKKYALRMQIWLLHQRFKTYINALKFTLDTGKTVILDRSVFSDWVFAEQNRREGNISEQGFNLYLELRKKMLASLPVPQYMVYLDTDPQECHRRILQLRKRKCESAIPLEYLQGLDSCYQEFINWMRSQGTTIIVLPWNNFGDAKGLLKLLKEQPLVTTADVSNLNNLRAFIHDSQRVDEASHLDQSVALSLLDSI